MDQVEIEIPHISRIFQKKMKMKLILEETLNLLIVKELD